MIKDYSAGVLECLHTGSNGWERNSATQLHIIEFSVHAFLYLGQCPQAYFPYHILLNIAKSYTFSYKYNLSFPDLPKRTVLEHSIILMKKINILLIYNVPMYLLTNMLTYSYL